MVQVALLACLGLLAVAPVVLAVSVVRFIVRRADLRKLLTSSAFLFGVLVAGWLIWQAATSEAWPFSFWSTLRAAVDSETYGHVTEHAAEVLASKTIILGVAGGVLAAMVAWGASARLAAGKAWLR